MQHHLKIKQKRNNNLEVVIVQIKKDQVLEEKHL